MSDLISRQKAIEALDFEIVHMTGFSNDEKNITNPFAQYNKGLEDGIKAIRALPSAEPERKKGRWLHKPNEYDDDTYECSRCGEPWTLIEGTPKENNMHYCPNCGARMEWE